MAAKGVDDDGYDDGDNGKAGLKRGASGLPAGGPAKRAKGPHEAIIYYLDNEMDWVGWEIAHKQTAIMKQFKMCYKTDNDVKILVDIVEKEGLKAVRETLESKKLGDLVPVADVIVDVARKAMAPDPKRRKMTEEAVLIKEKGVLATETTATGWHYPAGDPVFALRTTHDPLDVGGYTWAICGKARNRAVHAANGNSVEQGKSDMTAETWFSAHVGVNFEYLDEADILQLVSPGSARFYLRQVILVLQGRRCVAPPDVYGIFPPREPPPVQPDPLESWNERWTGIEIPPWCPHELLQDWAPASIDTSIPFFSAVYGIAWSHRHSVKCWAAGLWNAVTVEKSSNTTNYLFQGRPAQPPNHRVVLATCASCRVGFTLATLRPSTVAVVSRQGMGSNGWLIITPKPEDHGRPVRDLGWGNVPEEVRAFYLSGQRHGDLYLLNLNDFSPVLDPEQGGAVLRASESLIEIVKQKLVEVIRTEESYLMIGPSSCKDDTSRMLCLGKWKGPVPVYRLLQGAQPGDVTEEEQTVFGGSEEDAQRHKWVVYPDENSTRFPLKRQYGTPVWNEQAATPVHMELEAYRSLVEALTSHWELISSQPADQPHAPPPSPPHAPPPSPPHAPPPSPPPALSSPTSSAPPGDYTPAPDTGTVNVVAGTGRFSVRSLAYSGGGGALGEIVVDAVPGVYKLPPLKCGGMVLHQTLTVVNFLTWPETCTELAPPSPKIKTKTQRCALVPPRSPPPTACVPLQEQMPTSIPAGTQVVVGSAPAPEVVDIGPIVPFLHPCCFRTDKEILQKAEAVDLNTVQQERIEALVLQEAMSAAFANASPRTTTPPVDVDEIINSKVEQHKRWYKNDDRGC